MKTLKQACIDRFGTEVSVKRRIGGLMSGLKRRAEAEPRKTPYRLIGGPLAGGVAHLSTASTLPMQHEGKTGQYVPDPDAHAGILIWKEI